MTDLNKYLKQINEFLFYIIIEGFVIYGIVMEPLENPGWLYLYPYLVLMALAGIKICIQGNTWKEWVIIVLLGCVALFSYKGSGDRAVLVFALGACCARKVNLDKLLKTDIWFRIVAVILFILLPFFGIIPNHVGIMVGGRERTFFGWGHPNSMGRLVLVVILEWTYIRHGRFKWYDYAGIAGLVIFLDITANSRTTEVLMVGMLLLETVSALLKRYEKKVYLIWTVLSAVVLSLAVLLPFVGIGLYKKWSYFLYERLGTVGSRFILTGQFVENHGITLFGSPYDVSKGEYLDMLFANAMFFRGIVFGLIFIGLSVAGVCYGFYKKDEKYLFLLLMFFLYGLMETEHFNIIYTFFPVLLGMPIFYNSIVKVKNDKK